MFNKILVTLDGSLLAERALPHAALFASAFGAKVTLLHIVECSGSNSGALPIDPLEWRVRKAEAQAYLDSQIERLGEVDIAAEGVLLEGQPAQRIIEYVHESDNDLLVMSSHGASGFGPWNTGSLVAKVIQSANISTLLVRAFQPTNGELADLHYHHILAPLDGSPRAECVVAPTARLAEFLETELILAHVTAKPALFPHMPAEHEFLELAQRLTDYNRHQATDYLEKLQSRLPGAIATRVVRGDDIAARLHQLINEEAADLVVLSAHGHSGKAQWPYGSITANLLAYSSAPLLMVQDLNANQIEPSLAERIAKERIS